MAVDFGPPLKLSTYEIHLLGIIVIDIMYVWTILDVLGIGLCPATMMPTNLMGGLHIQRLHWVIPLHRGDTLA